MQVKTKEDAINLAKKDGDVRNYQARWKKEGHGVEFTANFDDSAKAWHVVCAPQNIIAGTYEMKIKQDGTIIMKEEVLEG